MKIQLTCSSNRREASFNQPHASPFSSFNTINLPGPEKKQRPLLRNLFFCLNRFLCRRSYHFSALHTTAVQYFHACPYCSVYVHKPHPGFVCSCCIVVDVEDFFLKGGRPTGLAMEGELIQQTLLNNVVGLGLISVQNICS